MKSKTAPITGWWTTIDRVPCNMHYSSCQLRPTSGSDELTGQAADLVINEWQLYNNEIISFQSAAPTIYIKC